MRDLVDLVAGAIYTLRITDPAQWALRLAALVALLGAGALAWVWFPVLLWQVLVFILVGAALWGFLQPDSYGSLVGIGAVALWWLVGGGGAWWQTALVAVLLAVHHLATGYAAAAPSYAGIGARGARRMLLWGLGYLGASLAAAAVVLGVAAVPADVVPRGIWWVALALAALTTAGIVVLTPSRPAR